MNFMVWQSSPVEWRKDILPLLLFFVLPILCFPELFFGQNTLYSGDLTRIHYPLRILAAEQWQAGQVPLWNPYVLLGFPLLAEGQVGILYPLNVLFLLPIPTYRALTLFVTIHFTLAATFTYILARSLNIGRAGATLGGLSFGFGGFLMAGVTNLNIMSGGVWLPLIFLFFSWALRVRRPAIALWGGIALALQALTAQPQIIFYTIVLLASYALYETGRLRLKQSQPFSRPKEIAWIWLLLALMLGSGFLLAAPQLLPTWELQRFSVRSEGLQYKDIVAYSLPPVQWLSLALPSAFGNNVASGYIGLSASFTTTHIYVGLLSLLLALLSWRVRHRPEVLFLWLVIIAVFFLAAGRYTPLYNLFQYLPVFNLFRAPARWSLVANFALAMLAAFSFETYLRQPAGWGCVQNFRKFGTKPLRLRGELPPTPPSPPKISDTPAGRRLRVGLCALWGIAAITMLGLWFFRESLVQGAASSTIDNGIVKTFTDLLSGPGFFKTTDAYKDRIILGPLAWWVLPPVALVSRLGLAIALLLAYPRFLSRRVFITAVVMLTAFDLSLAGGSAINHLKGADYWKQLSTGARYIMETEQDDMARFLSQVKKPEEDVIAGLGQYFASVYRVSNAWGHESPLNLDRYVTLTQELEKNPIMALSLTATRFILSPEAINSGPQVTLLLAYQDEGWYVYENPVALLRAFVVHQATIAASGTQALSHLKNGGFNLQKQVILETDRVLPPLSPAAETDDEVVITDYKPSVVEIEAKLASNGLLVLLDSWYPGWQVYVDGRQEPIMRANYFAQAVYLEAGSHTVQFIYRPLSFRGGLILSVGGLLIIITATWFDTRRNVARKFSNAHAK